MQLISKYDGLKAIESLDFPRPNWKFIKVSDDFPNQPWAVSSYGWTIRSLSTNSYVYAIPSKHNVMYEAVKSCIDEMYRVSGYIDYVVYPSWRFNTSGCLMIDNPIAVLEVVFGDISPLLRGSKNPDISVFDNSIRFISKLAECRENCRMDRIIIHHISSAFRVLNEFGINRVNLEWTLTFDREFFFHDLASF